MQQDYRLTAFMANYMSLSNADVSVHLLRLLPSCVWVPMHPHLGRWAVGMQHILEDTGVRVTVLKFGCLSSALLAYGGQDGVVRIAELGDTCTVRHVSQLPLFWRFSCMCHYVSVQYETCLNHEVMYSCRYSQ